MTPKQAFDVLSKMQPGEVQLVDTGIPLGSPSETLHRGTNFNRAIWAHARRVGMWFQPAITSKDRKTIWVQFTMHRPSDPQLAAMHAKRRAQISRQRTARAPWASRWAGMKVGDVEVILLEPGESDQAQVDRISASYRLYGRQHGMRFSRSVNSLACEVRVTRIA